MQAHEPSRNEEGIWIYRDQTRPDRDHSRRFFLEAVRQRAADGNTRILQIPGLNAPKEKNASR